MTYNPGYRLIDVPRDRHAEFLDVNAWAFVGEFRPEDVADFRDVLPWGRVNAMETLGGAGPEGVLAGVAASHPMPMRLPGGDQAPISGLTWVGVHPSHRRRGLLTMLMRHHLETSRERGEIASLLYAAEPKIYQRFGYGQAATQAQLTLARGADLRDVAGSDALHVRLERLSFEHHHQIISHVQGKLPQPGQLVTDTDPIARDRFVDSEDDYRDSEKMRIAIVEDAAGEVHGYAIFRRKISWPHDNPDGTLTCEEFATVSAAASHRMWSVLTDLDLVSSLVISPVALDDPLLWLLKDQRAAKSTFHDNVWLRLLDVPRALEMRGYAADADETLAITDALLPDNAGTWRLKATPTGASAVRTDANPDLTLDVQELSAAYLGGVSIATLTRAGLVTEHTAGAAQRLSLAMHSDRVPLCNFGF